MPACVLLQAGKDAGVPREGGVPPMLGCWMQMVVLAWEVGSSALLARVDASIRASLATSAANLQVCLCVLVCMSVCVCVASKRAFVPLFARIAPTQANGCGFLDLVPDRVLGCWSDFSSVVNCGIVV